MQTIKYTFEEIPTMAGIIHMPNTHCPHGCNAMVGSSTCQLCKHFGSGDFENFEIQCNYD